MTKKLFLGLFVFGLVGIPALGALQASESDSKPWEDLGQFRGGFSNSAKSESLDKEEFFAQRNAAREAHRENRLEERQARLEAGGCLDPQALAERLQQRKWRFAE